MADPVRKIRKDYHARHTSGSRPATSIRYFVIHDGEAPNPQLAAEGMGAYFQSPNAGGSTHYGVDVNSTQQYLPDTAIAWGAPPVNTTGLHVECAGKASFHRDKWLLEYGPMFERLGWLVATRCRKYQIPMRVLDEKELRAKGTHPAAGHGGIITHVTITDAFGETTHTDPGPGFPLDVVMDWARHYSLGPIKSRTAKPILHLGSKGKAVRQLEVALKRLDFDPGVIDSTFTEKTQKAVRAFQREHDMVVDGVVGPTTWKALGL